MISLPIDPYLPEIISLWRKEKRVILSASAGSGKTTRIPWALSKETNKKIIVLEPRKLAAKMAAARIADENNLTLGKEVGYAYRDDVRFTDTSRVIFFTEGTFIKFFSDEEFLKSIDTIIFDEFHERHIETDLCLALLLNKLENHPDLKFILMSATIDLNMVDDLNAKSINIESQFYQVKTHYLPNTPSILNQELSLKVKNVIKTLPSVGDILVFLPGMKEILKTSKHLLDQFGQTFILHSEIDKAEQEKIIASYPKRKIILATNLAESSITIPGIKYIIDSGIARVSEYNPWTGIRLLTDRSITQASATQRMYRAGRTQDGECFRLYSEFDYQQRQKFVVPEILTTELNEAYLLSCLYHQQLKWPTNPPEDKWNKAIALCELLGMSESGKLTEAGKFAIKHQLNIREAKIFWAARNLTNKDKEHLLHYVSKYISREDPKYLRRKLHQYLKTNGTEIIQDIGQCILPGMVDQVVKFRQKHNDFIHYSGTVLKRFHSSPQSGEGLCLAVAINQRGQIEELLEIQEEWLIDLDPYPLDESVDIVWLDNKIQSRFKVAIGSIIIEEEMNTKRWEELSAKEQSLFIEKNQQKFQLILESFFNTSFYKRYLFYIKAQNIQMEFSPSFKDYMNSTLGQSDLADEFFKRKLEESLNILLDSEVPEMILLNNKKFRINYDNDASIEGFIQDFFGITKSPTIMNHWRLTIVLLGPHKRPLQYTKDLASFWSTTYQEMLKGLKREYPRHHWPDDPLSASPVLLKRHLSF